MGWSTFQWKCAQKIKDRSSVACIKIATSWSIRLFQSWALKSRTRKSTWSPCLSSHRKHLITRIRKRIFFLWFTRLVVLVCNPSISWLICVAVAKDVLVWWTARKQLSLSRGVKLASRRKTAWVADYVLKFVLTTRSCTLLFLARMFARWKRSPKAKTEPSI